LVTDDQGAKPAEGDGAGQIAVYHCQKGSSWHVIYAATALFCAGLATCEDPEFGKLLLDKLSVRLSASLAGHEPDAHDDARLLLRALACLPSVNLIHSSSVIKLLQAVIGQARDTGKSGWCHASSCSWLVCKRCPARGACMRNYSSSTCTHPCLTHAP
jgi:hypothetical protein